ncbi:MAG: hypothetical protein SWH61_01250 [Thermodesulfobacteriota bacterium]|nr:hypothetical protein [Thermodesulfobacteriota bacterium]
MVDDEHVYKRNQLSKTMIVNGVEYNTYPPPSALVKVMKSRWAKELISFGSIRFGSLKSYREWENDILGDTNDGKGMFRMMGHPYNAGSINPVYAWCTSFPSITAERIFLFNVFQKDPSFAPDMEYRLSLTDISLKPELKPEMILSIGDCSDIVTIEELPNIRFEQAAGKSLLAVKAIQG